MSVPTLEVGQRLQMLSYYGKAWNESPVFLPATVKSIWTDDYEGGKIKSRRCSVVFDDGRERTYDWSDVKTMGQPMSFVPRAGNRFRNEVAPSPSQRVPTAERES